MHSRATDIEYFFEAGEWNRLLSEADRLLEETSGRPRLRAMVVPYKSLVLALRGLTNEAVPLEQESLSLARQIDDLQVLVPVLTAAAIVRASVGDAEATQKLANEFSGATQGQLGWRARHLLEMVRALVETGHHDIAKRLLVDESDVHMTRDRHSALPAHAVVAEAEGHLEGARELYQQAAYRWADYGFVLAEGQAHLGLARCLMASVIVKPPLNHSIRRERSSPGSGVVPLLNETEGYFAPSASGFVG